VPTPDGASPKGPGRPTRYSRALWARILERLRAGESLVAIARDPAMPAYRTVMNWLAGDVRGVDAEALVLDYARARELQGHSRFQKGLWALDLAYLGEIPARDAVALMRAEEIAAKRLAPKVYGDRIRHQGDPEAPLEGGFVVVGERARTSQEWLDAIKHQKNPDAKETPDG
jgi:hypothetical protein